MFFSEAGHFKDLSLTAEKVESSTEVNEARYPLPWVQQLFVF